MKSEEALEQIAYLKDITAKSQLSAARGYKYFIIWGLYTSLRYFGEFYSENNLSWFPIWKLTILITSIIVTVFIFIIDRKKESSIPIPHLVNQIGIQCLVLIISGIIIFNLFKEPKEALIAFWPLQIGIIYLVASVHMGRGLIFIGLWLIITSILSIPMPLPFKVIWLAITCGGGLIFTGILFKYRIKKAGN
jgi:hypothetical protein